MLINDLINEYRLIWRKNTEGQGFIDFSNDWKQGKRGTIIVFQGIHEKPNFITTLATKLHQKGFAIESIYSEKETELRIEEITKLIVERLKQKRIKEFIIVAHSKGGLIAKYLVDNYPKVNALVKKIVTIATPYRGTIWANIFKGYQQLGYRDDFLRKMDKITENNDKFVVFYPHFDNHVIPHKSLYLEKAKNRCMPVVGHTRILEDKRTIEEICSQL